MTDTEGTRDARERIQCITTLNDMLEIAASFEESALNFCAGLTPKVGKKVCRMVEELTKGEQQH